MSDLVFDRLMAGELDPRRSGRVRAHVAQCERCGARFAELTALRDAAAGHQMPRELATAVAARLAAARTARPAPHSKHGARPAGARPIRSAPIRRWGRVVAAVGGLAAVVAGSLVLRGPDSEPATRRKGARAAASEPVLGFFVRSNDEVFRGSSGAIVFPGDEIQFVTTSVVPRYLAVVSRDGIGQVSVYVGDGTRAVKVAPDVESPVPYSITLDGALGREFVYATFCPWPFDAAAQVSLLQAHATQLPPAPLCRTQVITWEKRAR